MKYDIILEEKYSLLRVKGSIEKVADCFDVSRNGHELLEKRKVKVVLDLTEVSSISASFCGFLVSLSRSAKITKTELSIVLPVSSKAYEVINLVNADEVLDIYPTMDLFLRSIKSETAI